jgi:hypothetical protein
MKYNLPESVGQSKDHLKGKFIALCAYIKKTATSQRKNIMLRLKLLSNKNKANSKPVDREI